MALRWRVKDPNGRPVCLFDETWFEHDVYGRHVSYDPERFENDMREAIRGPLLVHKLRRTRDHRECWAYVGCSSDASHTGFMMRVSVGRGVLRECDLVLSAIVEPQVHPDAVSRAAVLEIDHRANEQEAHPCGDARKLTQRYRVDLPAATVQALASLRAALERKVG